MIVHSVARNRPGDREDQHDRVARPIWLFHQLSRLQLQAAGFSTA
jgi:hypothetical protein